MCAKSWHVLLRDATGVVNRLSVLVLNDAGGVGPDGVGGNGESIRGQVDVGGDAGGEGGHCFFVDRCVFEEDGGADGSFYHY